MAVTGTPDRTAWLALGRVQLELLWNRVRREAGSGGLAASGLAAAAVAAALFPPAAGSLVLGYILSGDLGGPDGPAAASGLAAFHAFAVWFNGLLGLVAGGRPRFTDPCFRIYPVRGAVLLAAELALGVLDLVPLLGVVCIVSFGIGIAVATPAAAPAAGAVLLLAALEMMLVYHLSGAFSRLAFKRPRAGLVAVAVAAGLVAGLAAAHSAASRDAAGGGAAGGGAARLLSWLPSSALYEALDRRLAGVPSGWLDPTLRLLLELGIAVAATMFLLRLDAATAVRPLAVPVGPRERLWSFRRPAHGIARLLQCELLGTTRGRFLLVAPGLLAACLGLGVSLAGEVDEPLAGLAPQVEGLLSLSELPIFAIFPALIVALGSELWSNQFGGDGAGIRTLLGLPIPTAELLLGKLLGIARFAGWQCLLSLPGLLWIRIPEPSEIASGLAAGGFAVLFLGGLGHLISARFPSAQSESASASRGTPLARAVLPLAGLLLLTEAIGSTWLLARALHPAAPPLALVALFAAGLGTYRRLLPALARRVDEQRERLVEELG